MVILSNSPTANRITINSASEKDLNEKTFEDSAHTIIMDPPNATPPKTSIDTSFDGVDPSVEFVGDVNTNNEIPSQEVLKKVESMIVLDRDGKTRPFKSLYSGPNVARRVLVIFIRHFFCGNCQEYLRTLTASITEDSLLQLHTPTFIAVVGCGSPSLIPMYQEATNCPFPIYADPTKKLYDELGMMRTLNLGTRPEYQRRGTLMGIGQSVLQSLKQIKGGKLFQGGDYQQVGGEFLFEPVRMATPITSPADGPVGMHASGGILGNGDKIGENEGYEEKRITWCHRMKNTRDHAEVPEIREVLGFDEMVEGGKNQKRWSKALSERKGTGVSIGARSSRGTSLKLEGMSEDGGSVRSKEVVSEKPT
ncbi:putative thioredoxin-like protein [Botrytis fragariae]|uniref:Putative thioredoxin-like protein n=1 Tax=Botrytis fragariae TaxID=1964551 RepID=A0A8H6EK45_9HELO|nr:putative thioredoxin-like protein [Botrytis fragariae]KAF5875221.1 putative thioredoxin-like protein [Botrytis fragariae]